VTVLKERQDHLETASAGTRSVIARLDDKVKKHTIKHSVAVKNQEWHFAQTAQEKKVTNQKHLDEYQVVQAATLDELQGVTDAARQSEPAAHQERADTAAQVLLARASGAAAAASAPVHAVPIEAEHLVCAVLSNSQCRSIPTVKEALRIFRTAFFEPFEELFDDAE
jgi:hypothetical protein